MEEIKTGVILIEGYRSNLSNEIFLDEKEALQSDNAIRQRFAPRVIEKLMDSYLFEELKTSISDEIALARKGEDKAKFNKLVDLQEIVYNPSNANRSNQYFSKSPMQIATDMEMLLGAMSDAADYADQGYYDDKQISRLYQLSQGGTPVLGSHLKTDGSYSITFKESGSAVAVAQTLMSRVKDEKTGGIAYLQAISASLAADKTTYTLADVRLTPNSMKPGSFLLSIKTINEDLVDVSLGSDFGVDDTWVLNSATLPGITAKVDIAITWTGGFTKG